MARRRKKGPDIFEMAQALAVLIVLPFVFPQSRAALGALMGSVIWLLIFVVIFVALIAICWGIKVAISKNATLENQTTAPTPREPQCCEPRDDSRYMPKEAAPCQQDDSRYMPKETRLENDDVRYRPKPQKSLAQQIHSIDWFQFEKLVELAYAPTHKVTRRGGANPDGGIDLIIEDVSGQTAVQCKHWKSWKVGVRNVRELIGAMADAQLKKGILVTIKGYSADAAVLAARHNIELMDETNILMLLEKADAGAVNAILNDHRKFCPRCENEMVLRTARKGDNAGGKFWGCIEYPQVSSDFTV